MKKILVVLLLSVVPLYFITMSGCESTSGVKNGDGVIKGNIKDTTSGANLDSVVITTTPATSTVMTNSSGNYIISGVSDGSYIVTAKKPGYFTRTTNAVVADADTAVANSRMRFTGVYVYTNLKIQEANATYTNLSAVDLFNGVVINEVTANDPNKDIQMRCSYDTLGNSIDFYLRSGSLAKFRAGSVTKFAPALSNPKTGTSLFTKAEFDTLSYIYNFDGFSFNSYFPSDTTNTFNTPPGMPNRVYPFWLSGRATPSLQLFGVIFMREFYKDTDGLFYLVIDVKINKIGLNLFNGNQ